MPCLWRGIRYPSVCTGSYKSPRKTLLVTQRAYQLDEHCASPPLRPPGDGKQLTNPTAP